LFLAFQKSIFILKLVLNHNKQKKILRLLKKKSELGLDLRLIDKYFCDQKINAEICNILAIN
ncbi:hypothetical protein BpHYR1_016559, partial [Brachionus plicatilis]